MGDVALAGPAYVDLSSFEPWQQAVPNDKGSESAEAGPAIVIDSSGVEESPDSPDQADATERPSSAASAADEEVNLSKYEPPEALIRLPNVNSETIVTVVRSSVDNVRAQVAAEEDRRQRQKEQEAAERRRRDEAAEKQRRVEAERAAKSEAEEATGEPMATPAIGPAVWVPRDPPGGPDMVLHVLESDDGSTKHRYRLNFRKFFGKTTALANRRSISPRRGSTSRERPVPERENLKEAMKQQAIQDQEEQVECISCFDDFSSKDVVKTTCHSYCKDCFVRLINNAVENEAQWPPKCCLNPIPYRTVLKHIPADLRKKYEKCKEEFSIPVDERIYCAVETCALFIKKSQMRPSERKARCRAGHWTCMDCRQRAHPDLTECPRNADLLQVQRLATQQGWKRCYNCKNLVEHKEACQHMTCRCGAQFCYVCGERWRTCNCTMDQLAEIKRKAERQERQQRESTEREIRDRNELQDALRRIEEMEREQARRREELQRQHEEVRKELVAQKYRELRVKLAELNDLQHIMLRYQHDRELDLLRAKAAEAQDGLRKKQVAKGAELIESSREKLAEKEAEWRLDYHRRVAFERRQEEAYRAQLDAYWAGKPDGEQRAGKALRAFMRKNDQRFDEWQRHRDAEAERFRWAVEDEQAIHDEIMEAKLRRLAESFTVQEAGLRLKWKAEVQWFNLVVNERNRLLAELETVETDTPDDLFDDDWQTADEGEMALDEPEVPSEPAVPKRKPKRKPVASVPGRYPPTPPPLPPPK